MFVVITVESMRSKVTIYIVAVALIQCYAQAASFGDEQQDSNSTESKLSRQLAEDEYFVGIGIGDITGPAADINLMGYAKPNQDAGGIHLRQFSRAFLIEDRYGGRVLYINLDNGMISQLLRSHVIKLLRQHFGKNAFNETNVMLTATHTHSCPGGFFQYMLYNIPSAGFIRETFDALGEGILRSVQRAYASLQPATIYYNKGELLDASVNRSPTAYANNPAQERALYKHDTDKEMFLLRVIDRQHQPIAMLNWFAVHGTSMNNSNHLISSDNKGYAALLFEQDYNPPGTMPGKGKFVAIFAQANEGDASPNTEGPRCVDTGLPCDPVSSTCGNPPRNEQCIAFGPGRDMFESTKIIAYKQYLKAKQLFDDTRSQQQVRGSVRHAHQHIDMTEQLVPAYQSAALFEDSSRQRRRRNEQQQMSTAIDDHRREPTIGEQNSTMASSHHRTCKAALGYSFAAGTTDGPGAFDFQQGDTVSTKYWNMVRNFLKRPTQDLIACHQPKPILLATGQMDFPYMWHPKVVPTQVFMLGQVAIVGLPGEFTTMAGRRVREAVRQVMATSVGDHFDSLTGQPALFVGNSKPRSAPIVKRAPAQIEVVLSGLSNIYTSYVTTIEEYEVQRYEGASTLYGPHTLQAYVNQFAKLAVKLINFQQPEDTLQPPDLSKSLFTLKAGVIFDGAPHGLNFGSLLQDVDGASLYRTHDRVSVAFVAGNPRNDLRQEESFLYVERFNETSGTWSVVATDSSWETKFIWERVNTLFGESQARIEWQIPVHCTSGIYRIRHVGAHKSLLMQTVNPYAGKSSAFKVAAQRDADLNQTILAHQLETMRQLVVHLEQLQHQAEDRSGIDRSSPFQASGKNSMINAKQTSTLWTALSERIRSLGTALNPRRLFGRQ